MMIPLRGRNMKRVCGCQGQFDPSLLSLPSYTSSILVSEPYHHDLSRVAIEHYLNNLKNYAPLSSTTTRFGSSATGGISSMDTVDQLKTCPLSSDLYQISSSSAPHHLVSRGLRACMRVPSS